MIQIVEDSSKSSNSISFFLSMFSNPSAGWVLMNSIYMIYFLPLSREPLTTTSTKFCASIGNFKSSANIAKFIFNENYNEQTFGQVKEVGIITSNFWINFGSHLTIFLVILIALPLLLIMYKLKLPKISLRADEMLSKYKYSYFIRFWLQNHFIIGVYSLICLTLVIHK